MKHKGYCVKILYGELEAPKNALILSCIFEKREEPSISKGFDSQASQKIRRYDDKKVSYLLSSSAEGWRSSRLRKTSWVPELRSRTTSAIHPDLYTFINP